MLTSLFILLLTLAKSSDANSNDTVSDMKARYENIIDSHEQFDIQPILITFVALVIISTATILFLKKWKIRKNKPFNNKDLMKTVFLERWDDFTETKIFSSIIERCNENKELRGDTIMYFKNPLTASEISLFKATIDSLFNDFTHVFSSQHHNLSNVELDYCYISILPLTEVQKAGLLSLSYQGIVSRRKREESKLKKSLSNQKLADFMKKSIKNVLI